MEITAPRARAAAELIDRHGAAFWRTARRASICSDDAEDALQRAALILLTKAPDRPTTRLAAWMHVVTRREALAVRRERERILGGELSDHAAAPGACPAERFESRAQSLERMRLLGRLKTDERRALVLKGRGYSYAEISAITGWTHTKVNRCLAEGRSRLRQIGALA